MKFHECAAVALTTGQLWRQKGNRYYWFGLQYDKRVEKYSENRDWKERNCRRYHNSNGLFITVDELTADDWQVFDPPSDWAKETYNVWVPPTLRPKAQEEKRR